MARRRTIEDCQELALSKGGKCLSIKYINDSTKLKWRCKKSHVWMATAGQVLRRGSWCMLCSGKAKLTIAEMQDIAKSRGGKCLSTKYSNSRIKLKWQCHSGHIWMATAHDIKTNGSWCPQCASTFNISEELCRTTFEQIFKVPFNRIKPSWIRNKRGYKLELDGYNEKLGVAFEYQGEQHYKALFYDDKKSLSKRISHDRLKKSLCKKNNVSLIIITYRNNLLNLPKLIEKNLQRTNYSVSNYDFSTEIDFNKVSVHRKTLDKMHLYAKSNGGRCLSTKYINSSTKLEWQCSKGHAWMATPQILIQKTWCLICSGSSKLTIADMKQWAEKRGGKCLSTKYINNHTKLKWQCSKGHTWMAQPQSIKNHRQWCPTCAGNIKLTIEAMHQIAKNRGGKCLSTKYVNNKTKLKFQCKKNHIWMTTPHQVSVKKRWCPSCRNENGNLV